MTQYIAVSTRIVPGVIRAAIFHSPDTGRVVIEKITRIDNGGVQYLYDMWPSADDAVIDCFNESDEVYDV